MAESEPRNSVLFVCMGNTCRSPMAEAIFRNLLKQRNEAENWIVDSAAVMDWQVDRPVDPRAAYMLRKNGITGFTHIAHQVTLDDFNRFNFMLCMDSWNLEDLEYNKPTDSKCIVKLLGSYDSNAADPVIPDPFVSYEDIFEKVFHKCFKSCVGFLESFDKK